MNIADTIVSAGSETTALVLHAFFFYMTLHPEVQQRAQAEFDTVIGYGARLPGIRDRDRLPYVEALCKEVLRFHPPGPCGELCVRLLSKSVADEVRPASRKYARRCSGRVPHTEGQHHNS